MMNPSHLQYPVYLLSPPFQLDNRIANNVFMQEKKQKIDHNKALKEFLTFYNFLASLSLVYLLPQKYHLQDQTYVANLGVVLTHLANKPLILSNFKSAPRILEGPAGLEFFEMMGMDNIVTPPYHFEGEADCKHLRDNIYIVGYGQRTSPAFVSWLSGQYDVNIIPLKSSNPKAYHLDCFCSPLSNQAVLCIASELSNPEKKQLEKYCDIVDVPVKFLDQSVTNIVRVRRNLCCTSMLHSVSKDDERYEIQKHMVEFLVKVAAEQRLEPMFFEVSEFEKSGAALSCLVMTLSDSYSKLS